MNNLNLALTLTADGKQLVTTVNGSKKVISDLNTQLGKTGTQGRVASQGLNQLEVQGKKTNTTLKTIGLTATGMLAGLSAINVGQKIKQDLAAFQDVRTRITQLSGSTAAYAANEEYLMQISSQHYKELIPLANNYARLLSLQDAGLVTQTQARTILEGMSNAQSALGASTVQLNQSMFGLSQALASPIVKAEELNQVTDPLPGILNKMDKAAGLTAGGFRKMVVDGKVTSEFFRNTLISALNEYDGAAAATAANISSQSRAMTLAWQQMLVSFEQPISDTITPVLGTMTDALKWAAENSELLQTAIGGALVLALTRAGVATGSYLTQVTAKILKDREATAATIAEARAEIQRATVMRNSAISATQAAAADARLTAARNTLTAATQRATIAGRALNGVMALTGGPVGLALLAASSIAYFALSAEEAKSPTEELAKRVAELNGKFKSLNQEERASQTRVLGSKMKGWREEIIKTQAEIDKLSSKNNALYQSPGQIGRDNQRIHALNERLVKLKANLNEASAKQQALFNDGLKLPTETNNSGSGAAQVNKDQQRLLEKYTKQKALLADTSEAAKVRYEIEHGALKDLDPAINAKILNAAKEVDMANKAAAAGKQNADATKAQTKEINALLAVLDPVTAAANDMAEKEKLLKIYFEQANVPLEKRKQLLASLKTEYTEPSQFDNLRGQLDPTYSENQQHEQNMGVLTDEFNNTPESEVAKRAQINMLIELEQQRHAEALSQINGGISSEFDAMWSQTFDRFAAGIGSATADAIFESKNFGEAMQQIGKSAVKSVIAGLIEIGLKKLAMAAIDKTIMATTAATTTATAATTGAAVTASMAPAAATASIATMGAAPTMGMAAMMAAMAMIPAIIGQFHGGGTIPREGTYLLDGGETVYTRKQQQTLMNAMSATANGGGSGKGSVAVHQNNTIVVSNEAEAETLEEVLPQLVEMTKQAVADDLNNRGEVWQASS